MAAARNVKTHYHLRQMGDLSKVTETSKQAVSQYGANFVQIFSDMEQGNINGRVVLDLR